MSARSRTTPSTSTPTKVRGGRHCPRRHGRLFLPADASDYTKDIQGLVDQNYNIIVTVGFNLGNATITAAKANPNIWFVAVDVAPCVDPTGAPDSTFACKGDAATLLPKLIGSSSRRTRRATWPVSWLRPSARPASLARSAASTTTRPSCATCRASSSAPRPTTPISR